MQGGVENSPTVVSRRKSNIETAVSEAFGPQLANTQLTPNALSNARPKTTGEDGNTSNSEWTRIGHSVRSSFKVFPLLLLISASLRISTGLRARLYPVGSRLRCRTNYVSTSLRTRLYSICSCLRISTGLCERTFE